MRIVMILFLFLLLFCSPASAGSDRSYGVQNIRPDFLSAKAVVRERSEKLEVRSSVKAFYTVHLVTTILSREEQDEGILLLGYDANHRLKEFEGRLLDASGEEIRTIDEDDMEDHSATDGYTVYDDSRYKVASLHHDQFPYTVEFSYEIEFLESLSWPGWESRANLFPVEHTSFEVSVPSGMPFRHWCSSDTMKPQITTENAVTRYRWSLSSLPGIPREAADWGLTDAAVIVKIATDDFEIYDEKGSMKDWQSFGAWYGRLGRDQGKLPADAVQEIAAALRTAATRTDSIAAIYRMMQLRTRYVSIQLGIGGWKPFSAEYVHTRGYGDCKALVNYTQALLTSVGITARPVLINSGNDYRPMVTEFPTSQFNHVVLCIPNGSDSLWLECTSQTHPFGTLGWRTEDRPALLIDDDGGHVIRTPSPGPARNSRAATMEVQLLTGGTAAFRLGIDFTGNQQLEYRNLPNGERTEKRQEYVISLLELPTVQVGSFSDEGLQEKKDVISVTMTGKAPGYATMNSGRMFFRPSLLDRRTTVPDKSERRLSPYRFLYRYCDTDSILFRLPEGYAVESLPKDVRSDRPFGSFRSSCSVLGDTVMVYVRRKEITQRAVPAAQYEEVRSFFGEMVKTDRAQVVLKKK